MNIPEEGENKLTDAKLQGYAAVLSIGSTRCKANLLGSLYRVFVLFFSIIDSLCTLFCLYFLFNVIVFQLRRPQHHAELANGYTNDL